MERYLLQQPWTLRGFAGHPYLLIDPSGKMPCPVRPMNEVLWNVLIRCDGRILHQETRVHRILMKYGLIAPVSSDNRGLSPEQAYQAFPFEWRTTVQFSITGRCNLSCLHCFMAADKAGRREDDDLTCEELVKIVDQLPACGVSHVELTGGEPLCSPHFHAVVKRLTQRHLVISRILTNGFLVDDGLFDFLEEQEQRPEIVISFDGLGVHNWQRAHPRAQEEAVRAMELTRKRGFPLRCTIQVNRRSLPRLIETCRFLKEKGVNSFYLIRTSETPRWSENRWVDESLPYDMYYDAGCRLAEIILQEEWHTELQVFNGFHLWFDSHPRLRESAPCSRSESCFHRCGRARDSFFIGHTGYVWPCDAFEGIGKAGGFFGGETLRDRSLKDILENSAYARAMAVSLEEVLADNEECRYCTYFDECGGGCRAVGYGESMFHGKGYAMGNGRLTNKSVLTCTYYRGGYADRIKAMISDAGK